MRGLLRAELTNRFKECGLELHPDKTKIVYCKDGNRRQNQTNKSFDFLGYEFRARGCKNNTTGEIFTGFVPAASKDAIKSMRAKVRESNLRNRTDIDLNEIARWFNPILQGWMNYYGKYNRSSLYSVWRHFNKTLIAWAMRKYRLLRNRKAKASKFIRRIAEKQRNLFVHWRAGMVGAFI